MDSVEFMLHGMHEELRLMEARLVARIEGCSDGLVRRMANSEQRATRFDINFNDALVFDSYSDDLGGGPVFDSYLDDLGGGPIFDEDPFVDPVGDAAHDFDNVAVVVSKFTKSACDVHDQGDSDDLDGGPVFDTNPNNLDNGPVFDTERSYDHVAIAAPKFPVSVFDGYLSSFDKEPGDLSPACTDVIFDKELFADPVATFLGAILDKGPLLNEEPEPVEEDLTSVKQFVLDSNSAATTTTTDAPCTYSTKCLSNGIYIMMSVVVPTVAEEVAVPEPAQQKGGGPQPPAAPDPPPIISSILTTHPRPICCVHITGTCSMVQVTDLRDSMPMHSKHCTVTRQDIALLQDSYPRFLANKVFVNMPLGYLVANMIINMIMSTLDTQHTLSKFVIASSVKLAEILFRYIAPEQVLVQSGGLFKQEDPEFATSDAVTELTIQASSKEIIEIPAENSTIVWVLRVLGWEVSYAADFTPDLGAATWCFSWSSRLPWPHPSNKSSSYVAEIKFQKPTLALSLSSVVVVLMVRSKDSMGLSLENKSSGASSKGNTACLFGVSELLAQEDSVQFWDYDTIQHLK